MSSRRNHASVTGFVTGSVIALSAVLAMALSTLASAAALKSPEQVRNALRMLAYVQGDMKSKLENKTYSRLPHENQEFQEAAEPMRASVANESVAFRKKVEKQLVIATRAAKQVAELSSTNDDAKIAAAVAAVDAALQPLNKLFPAELRPAPGQGPGNGPPPGLR
jgi:hypothetical protein